MKFWRAIARMYWEWVVDCCTDDIQEIEAELPYLIDDERYYAHRELRELRESRSYAEKRVENLL